MQCAPGQGSAGEKSRRWGHNPQRPAACGASLGITWGPELFVAQERDRLTSAAEGSTRLRIARQEALKLQEQVALRQNGSKACLQALLNLPGALHPLASGLTFISSRFVHPSIYDLCFEVGLTRGSWARPPHPCGAVIKSLVRVVVWQLDPD